MTTHYIKRDLIDHADVDVPLGRYPDREAVLDAMLPEDAAAHTAKAGTWQGELVIVVEYDDHLWMAHDYYGSCAGCDYCIDAPREWGKDMLRTLYCFETVGDARAYLRETMEFGWEEMELREEATALLDEIEAGE